jgi:hypothetical protein
MTTITLQNNQSIWARFQNFVTRYHESPLSVSSFVLSLIFLSYFWLPRVGILKSVYRYHFLYILFIPLTAALLIGLSLRKRYNEHKDIGILSYVSAGVLAFYFLAVMAIPMVLLVLYFMY